MSIEGLRSIIEKIDDALEVCWKWDPEVWIDVEPHLHRAKESAEAALRYREREWLKKAAEAEDAAGGIPTAGTVAPAERQKKGEARS